MNLGTLILAGLRQRPLIQLLNLLGLSLGVSLVVALVLSAGQLRHAATAEARGIDLVVGATGSPLQLVLSTVYQADAPTGNIDAGQWSRWRAHPLVDLVVPLSMGDYVAGFRLIGTVAEIKDLYGLSLADGQWWEETETVVIGAEVARTEGLRVGDRLVATHGSDDVGAEAHDAHPLRVRGILESTGRVIDRLVLTDLRTYWYLHGTGEAQRASRTQAAGAGDEAAGDDAAQAEPPSAHGHDDEAVPDYEHDRHGHRDPEHQDRHDDHHRHDHGDAAGEAAAGDHGNDHDHRHEHDHDHDHDRDHDHEHEHEHEHDRDHGHDEHGSGDEHDHEHRHGDDHDHDHHHHDHGERPAPRRFTAEELAGQQVTALLLRYASPLASGRLAREINAQPRLQAAAPAQEMARLLEVFGAFLLAAQALAVLVLVVAAIGLFVALYQALEQRRYDIALLRALGASRRRVSLLLIGEAMVVATGAGALGLLLGHAGVELMACLAAGATPLPVSGWTWAPEALLVFPLVWVVALAAAAIPAWRAYRMEVSDVLAENA